MKHDIQTVGELVEEVLAELKPLSVPLTRKQAAYICGVDPHTIDHWCAKGLLKKKTRGGLSGYMQADLVKLKKI